VQGPEEQPAAAAAPAAAAEAVQVGAPAAAAISTSAPLPAARPGSAAAVAQAIAAEVQAEAAAAPVCEVLERWKWNKHSVRLILICAHTKEDFLQRDKPMPLRNQKDSCGRHWYWEKHMVYFNDKTFMPNIPVSSDEDVNEIYKKAKLDPNFVLDPGLKAEGLKADRLATEFTKLRKNLSTCLINHRASGQGYKTAAAIEEDRLATLTPEARADAVARMEASGEEVEMTEHEKVTKSHTVYSADFKHFAGAISCDSNICDSYISCRINLFSCLLRTSTHFHNSLSS
jgi:hypothetical protein